MKFRHKLLLFGLAVAALTAVGVFVAGGAVLRASVSDRVTERLRREIVVLADELGRSPEYFPDTGPSPDSIGRCDAFADRTGQSLALRLTLIAEDGRVVGDSALDLDGIARVENHAGRPEIVQARRDGFGESVRHSDTVHDLLYYVARRIVRGDRTLGFVRLAIPIAEIQRTTGGYRELLALACFLVLLGVAGVGYGAARRFSRPVEEMSRTADAIASGRGDLRVEYDSNDEIGRLGAAVNRMTRSLSEQIQALSSEKRLRDTIFAGMQEGILVLDMERRILLANDALRWILGLDAQSPSGRRLIEIVRDRGVLAGFDAALERGESFREIVRLGAVSERSFEINVVPLADSAGVRAGAIGIFFDVTRLMALESVRRDFVADASHELRTPLTSIKAFVETLLAGGLEDGANNRRFLDIIKKHADRMEAILDDLTDLSLIETGAIALEIERLELAPIVAELFDALRPRAEAGGVGLASQIPPGTQLVADRRRLDQVLLNLLDNAIKFSGKGATVTVRAETDGTGFPGAGLSGVSEAGADRRTGEGFVRVVVEDTGIGIPPSALEKIFHRFYRVDRARSREKGGTGLGLSIVKHLMRLHGGSVRVESEPGRGTRFILEFPSASPRP